MTHIVTAKSAGFCAGVARSVAMAETALKEYGTVYCLGDLVHNRDEVRRLEDMGMVTVNSAEDVPSGAAVLLRAHGEGRAVYDALRAKGARIIDTTCGKVQRIHALAADAQRQGRALLVVGDPEHPEVRGICGWHSAAVVARDAAEVAKLLESDEKLRQNDLYPPRVRPL